MTIEQKAKAYDEALERANNFIENGDEYEKTVAESIFAGLMNEIEDKIIRREIKMFIISHSRNESNGRIDAWLAWLEKQGEQKPVEWSEKDEAHIKSIISTIDCSKAQFPNSIAAYNSDLDWLKSLKDKVQAQPRQEWSKEDKKFIEMCIKDLELLRLEYTNGKDMPKFLDKEIEFLKSLRPQNWTKEDKERYISCLQRLSTGNPEQPETINSKWFKEHVYPQKQWKPSEEQIGALNYAYCELFKRGENGKGHRCVHPLQTLIDDLKTL